MGVVGVTMHSRRFYDGSIKNCSDQRRFRKIKNMLRNSDVIRACTKEQANINWTFYKLKFVTFSGAILKEVPMGCEDAALPKTLAKSYTGDCLTYEENTTKPYNDNLCLFRALASFLNGNGRFKAETSKLFLFFPKKVWRKQWGQIFKVLLRLISQLWETCFR